MDEEHIQNCVQETLREIILNKQHSYWHHNLQRMQPPYEACSMEHRELSPLSSATSSVSYILKGVHGNASGCLLPLLNQFPSPNGPNRS